MLRSSTSRSLQVGVLPRWLPAVLLTVAALIFVSIQAVREGAGLDLRIYRDAVTSTFRDGLPLYGTRHQAEGLPFTYPPFAAVFLAPLAVLPVWLGLCAVFIMSVGMAVLVFILTDTRLPLIRGARIAVAGVTGLSLATDPFRLILGLGQVDSALMLLVLVDVFVLPDRFRGVGIGIAAAVKLTPAVFVFYLIWRRQWRGVLVAVGTVAMCTALAEVLIPRSTVGYLSWLTSHADAIGNVDFVSNQSLLGMAARVTGGTRAEMPLWVGGCTVVAIATAVALSRLARHDFLDQFTAFAVVAVAGLLMSPISWSHHWTAVMVIAVVAVVSPDWRIRFASWLLWLVALVGLMWFAGGPPVGFIRGWFAAGFVSNALSISGIAWLAAAALGTKHLNRPSGFPDSDDEHQAAEQGSQHDGTCSPG